MHEIQPCRPRTAGDMHEHTPKRAYSQNALEQPELLVTSQNPYSIVTNVQRRDPGMASAA